MRRFLKPKRNRIGHEWITLSMVFLFLIGGCGGGTPPPSLPSKAKVHSVEKKKEEPTKVAEKKEEAEYSYNPAGKPDPFKPFIQLTSRGLENRCRHPFAEIRHQPIKTRGHHFHFGREYCPCRGCNGERLFLKERDVGWEK